MKKNNKTGILGGTFNPVHNGHIDLGLHVLKNFDLDSVRYILSARPPHKTGKIVAPVRLRWEMLKKGLEPYPELIPDDIEIKRKSYSWTIDTVRTLTGLYNDSTLYFISGSEGFLKIATWKNYRKLFELIRFIVVLRDPEHENKVLEILENEGIQTASGEAADNKMPSVRFFTYESEYMALSSTKIREMLKEGISTEGLLNNKVREIIEENDLYEKNHS